MKAGTAVPADAVITTPARYGSISLFRRDNTIGRSLLAYGEWAQSEIDLLLRLLPSGPRVIIDAGANIGTHTLAFSANAGADGRVYAFEAHPQIFFLLSESLRQTGCRNVDARNLGLSDSEGRMFVDELSFGDEGNFGHVEVHATPDEDSGAAVEISVITIDSLNLDKCDLIKVDVEGMEDQVLGGARETLRRLRPIVYAECLNVDNGVKVLQFLHDLRYDVWLHQARAFNPNNWYGSKENIFGLARESNLLAVPSERSGSLRKTLSGEPAVQPVQSIDSLARALFDTPRWSLPQWESLSAQGLLAQLWRLHEDKVRLEEQLRVAHRAIESARGVAARAVVASKREVVETSVEIVKATHAEIAATHVEIAARHAEIAATKAEVAAIKAEVAAAQAEVGAAQAEAAATQEECRRLERELEERQAERDRTVAELDADARTLVAQLDKTRESMAGKQPWLYHGTKPVTSQLRAVRDSRAWRAAAVVRSLPEVIGMLARSATLSGVVRTLKRFAEKPRRVTEASIVARSGLFDTNYYLQKNPDVARSGIHPVIHYMLWGAFEDRRPNALFEPSYYHQQYPDVARAGFEPLSHFTLYGLAEERNPGPHFDSRYYLASNPDVRRAGVNPLVHFLDSGWREGRSPSPMFDCLSYLARYEDVRASGVNPLVHYVESGVLEGREAVPAAVEPLPALPRIRLRSRQISARRPSADERPLIVCLTHVCPWPPHAGNSYRVYRMLEWLQRTGYRIVPVIVPLGGEMPDDDAIRKVEQMFSNVVVIDRNGDVRYTLTDIPDVLASLDGEPTPRYSAVLGEEAPMSGRERELLTIDRTYCPDAAIVTMLRLHSALGQYVLLAEYVWMTRILPLIDNRAFKVLDTIDVFSTKKEKVIRFGIRDLWLDHEEEARRLALADLIVAIQRDEEEILQKLVPDRPVVTAGIDFDIVGSERLPSAPCVLYVASGNPMNVRGLHDFLRFAWPAVREQVPNAEFVVAGAVSGAIDGAPPGVRALGRVDDLDELYRNARVVINPALAGTGVKIKTVEALSRLRPLVTWPTGVDGLPRELVDLCDIVRDWYEFGPRVVSRLVDGREEAFSTEQRERIVRATSSDVVYASLTSALERLWRLRVTTAAPAGSLK